MGQRQALGPSEVSGLSRGWSTHLPGRLREYIGGAWKRDRSQWRGTSRNNS
ncbi:uncharacterized protein HMPREF1541_08949 [Cyphellophora europaea CBS 101466]|uniref:Uncharacterized protein n=1 Tax=Cyphellophora europaea (strain CBS 101466) TaxID=1220924 RepID=W2RJL2_CYPE1|nr:uncharacterized protein HMPREF1541_08949 [Cyphellophora europaea CBS 101466]ETN36671.1 hypothetical protein HMPREF1541_08949 [Cyphellophora europaea CBS 101466]